jgi:hypothetical protein
MQAFATIIFLLNVTKTKYFLRQNLKKWNILFEKSDTSHFCERCKIEINSIDKKWGDPPS